MNKPVFGLLLGGFLGIFDGLSALVSAPETRPEIVAIVIGSTIMLPGSILGVVVGYATQCYAGRGRTPASALILLGALLLAPAVHAADAGLDPKAAFDMLKGMAGTWEGKAEGMPFTVTYEVASGGTIVMERLFARTNHEMINVYHLADGELRVVHYCSMGNQPMVKLDTAASKPGELVFAFAGGTNFDPAKDMHVHQARIRITGEDVDAEWGFFKDGKDSGSAKFQAHRTARAEAPAQGPAHSH